MSEAVLPCRLCGDRDGVVIAELTGEPVLCNVLWDTEVEARNAPTGDIRLVFCTNCGVIRNERFAPELVTYSPAYENSLLVSPTFRAYAEQLAVRLAERHRLHGRRVLEIGCGDGDFLALLCDAGGLGTTGIGFDPSYGGGAGRNDGGGAGRLRFVRGTYPTRPDELAADFVCSRHVLEHLDDPRDMVAGVRSAMGQRPDVGVYVEVPDAGYMLRAAALWDVIYEHAWYFTAPSLRFVFEQAGYVVASVESSFGGQYLGLEAFPRLGPPVEGARAGGWRLEVDELAALATGFGATLRDSVAGWSAEVATRLERGQRLAVWGIGSKGVTFLNRVTGGDRVALAVDVNPRKRGRHVTGSGQAVVGPVALRRQPPDAVLLMNAVYEREVASMLDELDVHSELVVVDGLPVTSW